MDASFLTLSAKGRLGQVVVKVLSHGELEENALDKRGWTELKPILKQKLLSAFISKQDTAVPVKQFGLFGEGLHFTKEVMQTYPSLSLFLVAMDIALGYTKPSNLHCKATSSKEGHTTT